MDDANNVVTGDEDPENNEDPQTERTEELEETLDIVRDGDREVNVPVPCPPGEEGPEDDYNAVAESMCKEGDIVRVRNDGVEVRDVLYDELLEQEIMNTEDCDGAVTKKDGVGAEDTAHDDLEPPGEEELEILEEIPVISIRSRSSSSSSRSSYSSRLVLCRAPSVPQPVVQSQRRPLLGPSPG